MSSRATLAPDPGDALAGGGEMGAAMRAHDWAATPLGPVRLKGRNEPIEIYRIA